MDCSWPKWPELLAKKLDMDCVNLGLSGAGNEYIYTTLLRFITMTDKDRIGLVVPAWTQCQRKDFTSKDTWWNKRIDSSGDVFSWMRRTLDNYLSFQILCERYNLPYMQIQMLSPYQDWLNGLKPREGDSNYTKGFRHTYPGDKEKDNIRIIEMIAKYDDLINQKKFLGWPVSHEYGGYSLQKSLINSVFQTIISEKDNHPNAKGHKKIAEFIYERL